MGIMGAMGVMGVEAAESAFAGCVSRVWGMCGECARTVFRAAPTEVYALNVQCFLMEICAQESGILWERQRSPRYDGNVGGFTKWQMELGWIRSALATLRSDELLRRRVTDFVFADPNCPDNWMDLISEDALLWSMRMNDNDGIGAALCRVGILNWPERIPNTIGERAALWKRRYNTIYGAGTVAQYVYNAKRLIEPYVSGYHA